MPCLGPCLGPCPGPFGVLTKKGAPRNFPIGRLNNYDKEMKKHKGPLSMVSELESIEDAGEKEDLTVSSGLEQIAKLDRNDSALASGSISSQVHKLSESIGEDLSISNKTPPNASNKPQSNA